MSCFFNRSNSPMRFTITLTSSHKGICFLFSFHTWSAILDLSIFPRSTDFWCSSYLTFCGRHFSPCILYHNCMVWCTHIAWSYCILFGAWMANFFLKKRCEYNNEDNDISASPLSDKSCLNLFESNVITRVYRPSIAYWHRHFFKCSWRLIRGSDNLNWDITTFCIVHLPFSGLNMTSR